jgi:hypothetical protein
VDRGKLPPLALPHVLIAYQGEHRRLKKPTIRRDPQKLPVVDPRKQYEKISGAVEAIREEVAHRDARLEPTLAPSVPGIFLAFKTIDEAFDSSRFRGKDGRDLTLLEPITSATDVTKVASYRGIAYVPPGKLSWLEKRLNQYGETAAKEKPRNAALIGVLDELRLANFDDLWTDDVERLPAYGEEAQWELWVRSSAAQPFSALMEKVDIEVEKTRLDLPGRQVRWVKATRDQLERVVLNSDAIVQVRSGQDLLNAQPEPTVFNFPEQAALVARVKPPEPDSPTVCILDTGAAAAHPLLAPAARSVIAVRASWSLDDQHGHGTAMSGVALYGDLRNYGGTSDDIKLTYGLESVKMIQDDYGASETLAQYTKDAVSRIEISAPDVRRVFCIAATTNRRVSGTLTTWSVALDSLAAEWDYQRLFVVAAGNVRQNAPRRTESYPDLNDSTGLGEPAQAYNALAVGGYTDLTDITDAAFKDYAVLASQGDLSPHSRTSVSWPGNRFRKPDIVMEAGNLSAPPGGHHERITDLSLITTSNDIPTFARTFDATSAAAAQAAGLAAEILASDRRFWPETARALIVHSASWTPRMRALVDQGTINRNTALKRWGYGVPNRARALSSAKDRLTVVIQDTLQPYRLEKPRPRINQMNLHVLPLPVEELRALDTMQIEMRVTLSYFVEPNAASDEYASHLLDWTTMKPGESQKSFLDRINVEERDVDWKTSNVKYRKRWTFGADRSAGTLVSDSLVDSAVAIADLGSIAIVPRMGWWCARTEENRVENLARYSLIVSFRPVAEHDIAIDLYTPFVSSIEAGGAATQVLHAD